MNICSEGHETGGRVNWVMPQLAGQLVDLPPWAVLAFATRCARRALHAARLADSGDNDSLDRIVRLVESIPERVAEPARKNDSQGVWNAIWGSVADTQEVAHEAANIARRSTREVECYSAWATAFAARAANYLQSSSRQDDYSGKAGAEPAAIAGEAALATVRARVPSDGRVASFTGIILSDLQIIQQNAKEGRWMESGLPAVVFYLNTVFDTPLPTKGPSICDVSSAINARLLAHFAACPELLYGMSPRQFEELIAEVVYRFGYAVQLTQRTRDGGFDVIALDHASGNAKYLIECKRYGPNKPISVGIVRQLGGALLDYTAGQSVVTTGPKGILATTSYFSTPASEYLQRNSWLLAGADFARVVDWLRRYDGFRMGLLEREMGFTTSVGGVHDPLRAGLFGRRWQTMRPDRIP